MASGPASSAPPSGKPAGGLAARCPACATVFRVVPDQLRVSDGWVRCGRCADVFNASEQLVDIETGAPVAASEVPQAAPALRNEDAAVRDGAGDAADDLAASYSRAVDSDADERPVHDSPAPESPGTESPARDIPALDTPPSSSQARDSQPFDSESFDLQRTAAADMAAADGAEARLDVPPPAAATPSFLRRAERAERWQRPRVRASLAVLGLLGLLVLAGQLLTAWRDQVAARFAVARPLLEGGCALVGCSVGAARSIESLAVDSSGLVRVEKSSVYRLSVALKNRASIDVALPAIDLILTDGQGRLLARRVFRAEELGVTQTALGAGRDLSVQATVQTTTDTVAGYTIDIFYP